MKKRFALLVLSVVLLLGACGTGEYPDGMPLSETAQAEPRPFPFAVTDSMSAGEKLAAG